jgi:dipeptidyl aminopeptidase/acylaminoacyl peptidase
MTPSRKTQVLGAVVVALLAAAGFGVTQTAEQKTEPLHLTIDLIMRGDEFVGTDPAAVMWSYDGKRLYFRWKKPGEKETDYYYIEPPDLTPKKITRDDMLKRPPVTPAYSSYEQERFRYRGTSVVYDGEKKRALIEEEGDLRLLDLRTGRSIRLTATDARESNARFSFDQKKIAFVSDDNLFLISLEDLSLRQLTSFTRKKNSEDEKPDELAKWYTRQQEDLFQEFKKGQERKMGRDEPPSSSAERRRKPFPLADNEMVSSLGATPDESQVAFILYQNEADAGQTIVPRYVTRSGFTETLDSHPKAAYAASRMSKAGIMSTSTGEVQWVNFGLGEQKVYPTSLIWSPDGKACLIEVHSWDRKNQWLYLVNPATATATVIEHAHDDAWVGPLALAGLFWWPDGRHVSYISEKDGYAHLYRASVDDQNKEQLTKGKFEVSEAWLSRDAKTIYLLSNEEHPGETHLYAMPAHGGPRTKITSWHGRHDVYLSPDEKTIAFIYSATNVRPELYLQPNRPGAPVRQATLSTTEEFRRYAWAAPEVIRFQARDGVDVYARLYKPGNWMAQGPAVIFIHGAGYLQNAHKGWSSYYREYMFHNFLMDQGYLVLDIDYRGSAGYGRDFRTGIYRHMGGKDLEDIIDGAKYLAQAHQVNPQRIGLYGGSYGGFLTLMGLFTAADYFRAGAALRPVTDWAHYQPWYAVDILNLPQSDAEAYKQSSPIYFAEGLKGALLICHGMEDTNVHFQDTVRLAQRLIELGKENWEVAVYPVEDHSFRNNSSWADEYKRIYKLFERNLK